MVVARNEKVHDIRKMFHTMSAFSDTLEADIPIIQVCALWNVIRSEKFPWRTVKQSWSSRLQIMIYQSVSIHDRNLIVMYKKTNLRSHWITNLIGTYWIVLLENILEDLQEILEELNLRWRPGMTTVQPQQ